MGIRLKTGPLKQHLTLLMHGHVTDDARGETISWLRSLSGMEGQGVFDAVQIDFINAALRLLETEKFEPTLYHVD